MITFKNPIFKPFITCILTIICWMNVSLHADVIQLENGDLLTGEITQLGENVTQLESPLSLGTLHVKSNTIQKITFQAKPEAEHTHTELLTLINNDILPCNVISLNEKTLKISTWYAGELEIPREYLRILQFGVTEEKLIYSGSDDPSQWSKKEGHWALTDNGYKSGQSGILARELKLPQNHQINFDLSWTDTPNFSFRFCAENNEAYRKQNTYEFTFTSAGIQIRRYLKDKKNAPPLTINLKPHTIKNKTINIGLHVDRKIGQVKLFINGTEARSWIDTFESPTGNFIILNNRSNNSTLHINNLKIKSGNHLSQPDYEEKIKQSTSDTLIDNEDDRLSGRIEKITKTDQNKRVIHFNAKISSSDNQILNVPDSKVGTLFFARKESPLEKTKHLTVKLLKGGTLQVTPPHFKDGAIITQHALLGSLRLDKSSISEVLQSPSKAKTTQKSYIYLTNGDKLSGNTTSINDQGELLYTSDHLTEQALFPLKNILRFKVQKKPHETKEKTLAQVTLYPKYNEPNDVLLGRLHELTPEMIKLDTWYGGIIPIKRAMVKSLKIINLSAGNYHGPNNISEWTTSSPPDAWSFQKGTLQSYIKGFIGKDIGLIEKSHISFDVTWSSYMSLAMHLYSSDITKERPDAYYELSFNSNSVNLATRGNHRNKRRLFGGGRRQQINLQNADKKVHLDIFADRKLGAFTIYINKERACVLQSETPDPKDLGTGISFHAYDRYKIGLSNISIIPWNGTTFPKSSSTLAKKSQEADPEADPEEEQKSAIQTIELINGDSVPGTIGKVKDGKIMVKTDYAPIKIPINRIKKLALNNQTNGQKRYAKDVRAWFRRGGFITLKLATFENGKINGYNQAFGDVTLDSSAFNLIDFNIYIKDYEKIRQSIK